MNFSLKISSKSLKKAEANLKNIEARKQASIVIAKKLLKKALKNPLRAGLPQ